MKNAKPIKLFSFILTIILSISLLPAFAVDPSKYVYNTSYKLTSGVKNVKYFMDDSVIKAGYYTAINDSLTSWVTATKNNSINSKVTFTRVYTSTSANIIFKIKTDYSVTAPGYVCHFNGTKQVSTSSSIPSSSWTYAVVYMQDKLTTTAKRVATHEIGHCLGLSHPATSSASIVTYSVMYASNQFDYPEYVGLKKYIVDYTTSSDASNIAYLYK